MHGLRNFLFFSLNQSGGKILHALSSSVAAFFALIFCRLSLHLHRCLSLYFWSANDNSKIKEKKDAKSCKEETLISSTEDNSGVPPLSPSLYKQPTRLWYILRWLFQPFRLAFALCGSVLLIYSFLYKLEARRFSTEAIVSRHEVGKISEFTPTKAAVKNPTPKIVYDEHNHERYPSGEPSKRAFAYLLLTGGRFVYASLIRLLIIKFILSTSASEDVLALTSLEVDSSGIEPGTTVSVKWRGKPVFVRHRTEEDWERVKKPEWGSVLIWVAFPCQMLVILVVGFALAMAHTTILLGRIRKGPAPYNLEVPSYTFLSDDKLHVGETL